MFKPAAFVAFAAAAVGAPFLHAQEPGAADAAGARGSEIEIPRQMAAEHEALHAELADLVAGGGRTGEAAQRVEEALAPHFEAENRFALPPLGLLPALARGEATEEMRPAIEMARHVEQNLDRFIREHGEITRALDGLEMAAEAESNSAGLRFAAELRAHAQQEEEVLYPTTILIGRYLERMLGGR